MTTVNTFLGYRNLTPAQHTSEDFPTTPDVNSVIKQGYTNVYNLTAGENKVVTIPTDAKFAIFCADYDIWVKINSEASIPVAGVDITDGSGSELNPCTRYLDGVTTMGIISERNARVSIMFYK